MFNWMWWILCQINTSYPRCECCHEWDWGVNIYFWSFYWSEISLEVCLTTNEATKPWCETHKGPYLCSQRVTMIPFTGLILGLCPANGRHHYKVMLSLIGWAQTLNQPCNHMIVLVPWKHLSKIWSNQSQEWSQVSNIRRTLVGKKNVDHSDVVGASPFGAVPTTSSF